MFILSSVHRILQARILEWVAIQFSRDIYIYIYIYIYMYMYKIYGACLGD